MGDGIDVTTINVRRWRQRLEKERAEARERFLQRQDAERETPEASTDGPEEIRPDGS